MSGAAREMTLDEWVARLPEGHRARRELAEMRESLSMACVTPAGDCTCSGCLYANESHAMPAPTPGKDEPQP